MQSRLETAWRAWRSLSSVDRARFLILLREAYARQREAVLRRHGGGDAVRASSLTDLRVSKADLQRGGP